MSKYNFYRIPFATDKVLGLFLLVYILCSLVSVTVFSEPIDSPRLFIWSVLTGVILLIYKNRDDLRIKLHRPEVYLLAGLWFWSVFATIFSLDHINSLLGVNLRMTSSLWFFTLFILTILLLSGFEKVKLLVLLKLISYIAGVISLWAILQSFGVGFYDGIDGPVRSLIPSFLGNPNFAAMFIGTALFLNIYFFVTEKSKQVRLLQLSIIAAHVAAFMIFASRGAVLGVVVGALVLIVLNLLRKQWLTSMTAVIIVMALIFTSFLFMQAIRSDFFSGAISDQSVSQRWYAWDNSFTQIIKHPISGSGLGNYFIAYRQNQESYLANQDWFDDPHNLFLHLAVSGGIPMSIIFLSIILLAAWYLLKNWFYDFKTNVLNIYILASLISWVVAACFNPATVTNWLFLALLLGYTFTVNKIGVQSNYKLPNILIFPIAIILIILGASSITSEILLWQAVRSNENLQYNTSMKLAQLSVDFNPTNLSALNQLAMEQYFNNKFDESFKTLKKAEALHPLSAGVYQDTLNGYMNLYKKTSDIKYRDQIYRSIKDYDYSYDNHEFIHKSIANLLFSLGDYENALIETRRWVVLSQGGYDAWLFLSNLYEKTGNLELRDKAKNSAFLAAPSIELRPISNSARAKR